MKSLNLDTTEVSDELLLKIVSEGANKATSLVRRSLGKETMPYYRDGDLSFKLLAENVVTIYMSKIFKPFCPFFESINSKIDQLMSAGIISHWINSDKLKINFDEIGPQVLTWEHLELGFAVCMIPLLIGIVVFLCECFVPKIKREVRSCLVKITVFNLIKSFLDSKLQTP